MEALNRSQLSPVVASRVAASIMETTSTISNNWFGEAESTLVLLGYSSAVDFACAEGFRTAVVANDFALEDILQIDHPIQANPEDEVAVRENLKPLHAHYGIKGIVAFDDLAVLIGAKAREWFELRHAPSTTAINHCIHKDQMRAVLAKDENLSLPYRVVEHESEVAAALEVTGLPAVVKPVDSSNSRHVELCRDPAAAAARVKLILEWAAEHGKVKRALIEPYLDGPEFSIESFTHDGETTVVAICEKVLGPVPYFVEIGHYCPTRQTESVERALIQATRNALALLGVNNLVTHTELRMTPRGIKIIEINPRPAGGKLREFIRTVTGYDLHEAAVRIAIGERPIARVPLASHGYYHCLTAEAAGIVSYDTGYLRNPMASGLYPTVELTVKPQERVYPINHEEGGVLGRVLLYGSGFNALGEELQKILAELRFQIRLDPAPKQSEQQETAKAATANGEKETAAQSSNAADAPPQTGSCCAPAADPRPYSPEPEPHNEPVAGHKRVGAWEKGCC